MLRGINNKEAAAWLMSVQRTSPGIVYQTLFDKARQEYPKKRFQNLVESLQESVVLN
jgi:hypothetical protein